MSQGRVQGKKVSRLDFTRRDFHKLTMAAFGGVVGGLSLSRRAVAFGGGGREPLAQGATRLLRAEHM